jgi:hypothetical protein
MARDPAWTVEAMVSVGFLRPDHGLDPNLVFEYVSAPYVPYLVDEFTFTRQFTADALAKVANIEGPHSHVIRALNMPPSFVILDRVVWGVSALLGKLEATGPWRGILDEYRHKATPATELGRLEAQWSARRSASSP